MKRGKSSQARPSGLAEKNKEPVGPAHALEEALTILGPYPLKSLRFDQKTKRIVEETITREGMKERLMFRAWCYCDALAQDEASPRVSVAMKNFAEISSLAKTLAEKLAALSPDERRLLQLTLTPKTLPFEDVQQIKEKLPQYETPFTHGPNGSAVLLLDQISRYFSDYREALRAGEPVGGAVKGDRGGRINIARLLAPSPAWFLLRSSWAMFEEIPHLRPSATSGAPLHRFLLAFDEWVTGNRTSDTNKFESMLKYMGRMKRRQAESLEETKDLIVYGGVTNEVKRSTLSRDGTPQTTYGDPWAGFLDWAMWMGSGPRTKALDKFLKKPPRKGENKKGANHP